MTASAASDGRPSLCLFFLGLLNLKKCFFFFFGEAVVPSSSPSWGKECHFKGDSATSLKNFSHTYPKIGWAYIELPGSSSQKESDGAVGANVLS